MGGVHGNFTFQGLTVALTACSKASIRPEQDCHCNNWGFTCQGFTEDLALCSKASIGQEQGCHGSGGCALSDFACSSKASNAAAARRCAEARSSEHASSACGGVGVADRRPVAGCTRC